MKVKTDTIARTIVLIVALVNQCLAIFGKGTLDIAEEDLYQLVSVGATIAASIVAWWKNNSFTGAAIAADEGLREAKSAGKQG